MVAPADRASSSNSARLTLKSRVEVVSMATSSSPATTRAAARAERAAAVICLRLRSSPVNSTTTSTASSCWVCEVRSSRASRAASCAALASTRLRRTVLPRCRRDFVSSGRTSEESFLLAKFFSFQVRISGPALQTDRPAKAARFKTHSIRMGRRSLRRCAGPFLKECVLGSRLPIWRLLVTMRLTTRGAHRDRPGRG